MPEPDGAAARAPRRRRLRPLPSIARLHTPLCLADGLFRSLDRRAERHEPFEILKEYEGATFVFTGVIRLGCEDLRMLQAAVALFEGPRIRRIDPDPQCDLWAEMKADGTAEHEAVLAIATNPNELTRVAGYGPSGGKRTNLVLASLNRLHGVEVAEARNGGIAWRCRLLAWDQAGAGRRTLRIALNPAMSAAALGAHPFTVVDLAKARLLDSAPAMLLHHRLSAAINPGRDLRIGSDRLAEYVWGPAVGATDVMAHRDGRLIKVLEDLAKAGWRSRDVRSGLREITRPGVPK